MLVRIENIALILLKCEDIKRNLQNQNQNEYYLKILLLFYINIYIFFSKILLQNNLKNELNLIITNLSSFEIFPTMMMIQKGRFLIFNVMDFCELEDMFKLLKVLVESLHKFGKRIPEESVIFFLLFINKFNN